MKVSENNAFNNKTSAITFLLPMMFNWIEKTMYVSDEL